MRRIPLATALACSVALPVVAQEAADTVQPGPEQFSERVLVSSLEGP